MFREHSPVGSKKIPGHFSTTAGCSVEREQSTLLTSRVKPGCRSQPHAGTQGYRRHPVHLQAGGLWNTGSLWIQTYPFPSACTGRCWAEAFAFDITHLGNPEGSQSTAGFGSKWMGSQGVMIFPLPSQALSPSRNGLVNVASTSNCRNSFSSAHDGNDALRALWLSWTVRFNPATDLSCRYRSWFTKFSPLPEVLWSY